MTDIPLILSLLGNKIKRRRKGLRMTQTDLSRLVGISRTSITNIELGRQNIGIDRLITFADALQCDLADLLPKIR